MKTSLNTLRATNACTGGFIRQASFWTVRPKAKAIEYPIWLIGLTGNYEDMQWAINNALIVVDEDFKELKARTFWPMFQHLFWQAIDADHILRASTKKATDFQRVALKEALALKDTEGAQAWMDKYTRFHLNTPLFAAVANNACWCDAQVYLRVLTQAIAAEKSDLVKQHERLAFDLDHHVPGHDTRTGRASPKKAATGDVTSFFDMPKRSGGRVVTKGEQFAYVCLNRDPWPVALQFMMDNDVPKIIGSKVMLTKVSEEGKEPEKFHASINLSDPRIILTLMHLLQGQDFDIFKALHIEQRLERMTRVLRRDTQDDSLEGLDEVIENKDRAYVDTQRRIVEAIDIAESGIADLGPTGGAIREREINTGDDEDEGAPRPVTRRVASTSSSGGRWAAERDSVDEEDSDDED